MLYENLVEAQYGHQTNTGTDNSEAPAMAKVVPFKSAEIGFAYQKLEVEPVPLGRGTQIEIQLAEIPLENLKLDRTNPRLRYKLETLGLSNPSQDELTEILWEDDEVKRLKRSIQATGGLIEAIVVNGTDGTVLEGNCRTVCFRKLAEEFPEDEIWAKVRARIVPPDVHREQISMLLGELHIAGKNEWSPFEQAAHLYEMNSVRGFAEKDLAEMYRQSKSSINSKIRAYKLMSERYLPSTSGNASLLDKWSYFEEFFKKCKPKAAPDGIQLEEDFVGWMLEDKFQRGAEVRYLPDILADPEAVKALNDDNADAAWQIVQQGSPEMGSKLFKNIVAATDALRSAPLDEVNLVKEGDGARLRELKELNKALHDFAKQTGRKL